MRFLVDENMSQRVVALLRDREHDVLWASDSHRSDPDPNLLEFATLDRRTLVTFDTDFGRLIHQGLMPAPYGVLLFRLHDDVPPAAKVDFVAASAMVQDPWPAGLRTIQIRHHG